MSDLISREAAIAELSLRNELLHRQFEALEISREDGVYQICIDAIRALPSAPVAKAMTVAQAARVLLACNGADLDDWTDGDWPDDDAMDALKSLAALECGV